MGEFKLDIGAVVDVATSKDVADLGDKLDKYMGRYGRDRRPIRRSSVGNTIQANAAGGTVFVSCGGPPSGRIWFIRQVCAVGADPFTNGTDIVTAFGAAGTATLTLPPGATLLGLTIESAAAAAAVNGIVTVNGGVGGTQNIDYQFTTQGTQSIYPFDLAPSPAGTGQITVVMPAVTGGSAGQMVAVVGFPVAWFISQSNAGLGMVPNVGLPELIIPGVFSIPMAVIPGDSDGLFVKFGEYVICQVNGVPLGQSIFASIRVEEYADSVEEIRTI